MLTEPFLTRRKRIISTKFHSLTRGITFRILDGWTIIDRLHLIEVPTLVLNGRYDIAQGYVTQPFSDNIPNSTWVTFENSSHTPFWEEREQYMQVVGDFLGK